MTTSNFSTLGLNFDYLRFASRAVLKRRYFTTANSRWWKWCNRANIPIAYLKSISETTEKCAISDQSKLAVTIYEPKFYVGQCVEIVDNGNSICTISTDFPLRIDFLLPLIWGPSWRHMTTANKRQWKWCYRRVCANRVLAECGPGCRECSDLHWQRWKYLRYSIGDKLYKRHSVQRFRLYYTDEDDNGTLVATSRLYLKSVVSGHSGYSFIDELGAEKRESIPNKQVESTIESNGTEITITHIDDGQSTQTIYNPWTLPRFFSQIFVRCIFTPVAWSIPRGFSLFTGMGNSSYRFTFFFSKTKC